VAKLAILMQPYVLHFLTSKIFSATGVQNVSIGADTIT